MATFLKAFVFLALLAAAVSAPTHHLVGWGHDSDLTSWLSGRVFTVGDKILFKYSGTEDTIVELKGLEDFATCNLTNPIQMYTDPVSHVALENEGPRYFTSANLDRCRNGLKLPVNVRPASESPYPDEPSQWDPPFPDKPSPPEEPYPPFKPAPPYDPPVPVFPPPSPPHVFPVPPPPYEPSAATRLGVLSFLLGGGLLIGI